MFMGGTREDIIEAATKLFLLRSYDGVSIKDITQAMGMTKGALYHHFESKEALFAEVAGRVFSAFGTDYGTIREDSLRAFYRACVADMEHKMLLHQRFVLPESAGQVNYFRILWDAMSVFQSLAHESMAKGDASERDAWNEVVQRAQERGELRAGLDAEQIAQLFIHTAHGVKLHCLMSNVGTSVPGRILVLWDSLYESVKA